MTNTNVPQWEKRIEQLSGSVINSNPVYITTINAKEITRQAIQEERQRIVYEIKNKYNSHVDHVEWSVINSIINLIHKE